MSQDIRRELISKNLGIKPINHGQVYTFQIALPDSKKQTLSLEQQQAIEQSLLTHQSNLVSLIIRRTESYDNEEIEYELVYGADWFQVAQALEIEKVWAWVFDLTDEQAIAAAAEMESLTSTPQNTQLTTKTSDGISPDIANLIDEKLQLAANSIKNSMTSLLTSIRNDLDESLKILSYKIDNSNQTSNPKVNDSDRLGAISEKLDTIYKLISKKVPEIEKIDNPIDLLKASDQEIEVALKQIDTQDSQVKAAINAVHYYKNSEGLTWENLASSARANTNAPNKIKGFAKGTYDRLYRVSTLPGDKDVGSDNHQDH